MSDTTRNGSSNASPSPLDATRHNSDETPAPPAAEDVARRFHDTYERLAPDFAYKTRKASAVPWPEVPSHNKRLMIAVCEELLSAPAPTGWKTIESAPRDGTPFLVLRENGSMVVGVRHNLSSRTDEILSKPGGYAQTATHWMPLPEAPR